MGLDTSSYALLNEDGDAQIYANRSRRRARPTARRRRPTSPHKLLTLIQSGAITRARHHAHADRGRRAGDAQLPRLPRCQPQPGRHRGLPAGRLDAEPGRRHQHDARPVPGAHPVSLRPPRRLLRRRALRPAHHGRPGVQERRDAAAPGAPPRGRADRAGDAGRARSRSRRPRAAPLPRRWSAIRARRSRCRPTPPRREIWSSPAAGSKGRPPRRRRPRPTSIVLDVAGLYDDELFDDATTATAAAGFRALAAQGTRFEDCWTESRDWPVTEYQMLTGGYPGRAFRSGRRGRSDGDLPARPGALADAAAGEPRRRFRRLRRLARVDRLHRRTACSTPPWRVVWRRR